MLLPASVLSRCRAILLLAALLSMTFLPALSATAPSPLLQPPVLKWQRGGCYSSWCETGWYSSPAVADLDGDAKPEVIGSAYSLWALNGEDGSVQWSVDPPGGRTWPGVVVADLEGDGDLEVVVAQSGGYVSVYDHAGTIQPGWPQQPTGEELRGLSVYDLDTDGALEIVVTATGDESNTWVYEHDGTLRPGWPQLAGDSGYAWGVYNDNAALGDLDGDGSGEIVVPSDVHYICAYELDGSQIPASSIYGDKGWGKVGVWESLEIELRGWGACNGVRKESYRTNFADGPADIVDVDGNGVVEVVATGNVYDCHAGYPPSRYVGVYVFNGDRSRFNASGYDWQAVPVDTGAPLVEDYNVIESVAYNPVTADLDGDGHLEILFASYDGRLHAFWLDKTEHGSWPYAVYNAAEGVYRFASEPAVADLDGDGQGEVIFSSWVQKGTNLTGKLHILDALGNPLQEVDLPPAFSGDWNGAIAAPTLADIDGDPDLEVVLNTAHSGLVAYDLPGTAGARVLWGTGRGSNWRNGSVPAGGPPVASLRVYPTAPDPGDRLDYALVLRNPGRILSGARVVNTLPAEMAVLDYVWASAGRYGAAGNVITWTGALAPSAPVTITFGLTLTGGLPVPHTVVDSAWIDDGQGGWFERRAVAIIGGGYRVYLPLLRR
jgi:hypothetical protein